MSPPATARSEDGREFSPEAPGVLAPLIQPARYKAAFGGRGGGKSHFFATMMVARCLDGGVRCACIREVQNTIKESVRQLLVDKIALYGLQDQFRVLEGEIHGPGGSLIIFKGMQSFTADNIKSLEGYDIAWVEEAQTLSERSLRILRPTIRKEGSELWFSWNPRYDTDAVDAFFRSEKVPEDAIVVSINWDQNPFFPKVLKRDLLHDFKVDPEMAEHIWNGGYEIISEASYYAKWLREAEKEGRIGDYPHRPELAVHTAWDIGVDDYTSIWFFQEDGETVTVLDYYETSGDGAEQIVQDALPEYDPDALRGRVTRARIGRTEPWRYGKHFFPHDIKVREWGAGARSRIETMVGLGLRNIHKGAQGGPEERINASRQMLPITRFNNTRRVQIGLSRLRRYSRKFNEQMGVFQGPLKDGNDHGADAFGEYAVNCPLLERETPPPKPPQQPPGYVVLPGPPGPRDTTRIKL